MLVAFETDWTLSKIYLLCLLRLSSNEQTPSECCNWRRQGKMSNYIPLLTFPQYWDRRLHGPDSHVGWVGFSQGKQQNVMVLQMCIFMPLSLLWCSWLSLQGNITTLKNLPRLYVVIRYVGRVFSYFLSKYHTNINTQFVLKNLKEWINRFQ